MPGRLENRVRILIGNSQCRTDHRSSSGPGCTHHRRRVVRSIRLISRTTLELTFYTLQSSSGIGLESSLLFASEGAHVLLVDLNLPAAERVEQVIRERFPNVRAKAAKADVGKEEDVKAAVDLAVETFGRLDVMVRLR